MRTYSLVARGCPILPSSLRQTKDYKETEPNSNSETKRKERRGNNKIELVLQTPYCTVN
jgi:hypothetical protein